MQKKSSGKLIRFAMLMGATSLSLALGSVPHRGRVTDDTAIYQNLSEIQIRKQGDLNFDADIAQLSAMEGRYAENLPVLSREARLKRPAARIAGKRYQYSGDVRARSGSARNDQTKSRVARKSVQMN